MRTIKEKARALSEWKEHNKRQLLNESTNLGPQENLLLQLRELSQEKNKRSGQTLGVVLYKLKKQK